MERARTPVRAESKRTHPTQRSKPEDCACVNSSLNFGMHIRLPRNLSCLAAFVLLWPASLLSAQTTPATNSEPSVYEFREQHDRDGIGKFYLGREIAQVMGHQAADWLERPEREAEEKPSLAIEALNLKPGETVADIGAGTGYYTRRLAGKVGTNGTVFAVEIQQEMLDLLTNKMAELNIHNVKPVLGTVTDPRLPANSTDLILMVDVYHEFDHPREMTQAMLKGLKIGGRLVFIEFRGEDPQVPIKPLHKMTEAQVRKEMASFPLEWVQTLEVLPIQHIIVFRKKSELPP